MPTTLTPGDIAIVGFRSGAPDGLAFVTFKDLEVGTMLGFTDASYQQPGTPSSWRGTENFSAWTAATAIPAGTVVVLSFPNSPASAISDSGAVSGALNGLSGSGDQIFVYQRSDGTVATSSPFTASVQQTTWNSANGGSLLFGINLASAGGFVTSGTANLNSTNTSYVPDAGSGAGALTLGTTALNITNTGIVANAQYNGARSGLSADNFKTQILNQNNWVAVDATTGALDSTDLTFSGGAALPAVNLSVSAVTASEAGGTVITVTATAASAVTGDQTVNVSVTGTGITAGDYAISAGTITILNGATTGTVTFTVVDDAIAEGAETAVLTLSNPSVGVTLGGTITQGIAIADNDSGLLSKVGGFTSANGAEIPAFDPGSDRLFTVAGTTVEILSVSSTGALALIGSLTPGFTPPAGTNAIPNSVAVKNGIVAVAYAVQNATTNAQEVGQVSFYNAADGTFLNSVAVGFLPDMLIFTPDGTKVLVANEGEPNSYAQATSFDPEGSVSVIDLAGGVASATVRNASFTSFNSQIDALRASGVRIIGPGSTVAQDVEPEYIAVASDGLTAQVTLQENNAIAILDIASATITQIIPLGVKDHSLPGNGLDASDQAPRVIDIRQQPVFGLYQPDAIASFTANGQTYYITANEGDARDYAGFAEEVRVGAATLDPTLFPNAATLQNNANLGRLNVSRTTSDKDGDGDLDRIEAFGARSFSIRDANGTLVFDSGDQLEQIIATLVPTLFNSDGAAATFDTRSDNKGPEPEGVAIGVINNRTYAFIGLERVGDVIVYEVTNPNKPVFVQYINTPEDISPEGLAFIAASDSPTGKPLLATANEVSKTVSLFEIAPPVRISDIQGAGHISVLNGQGVRNVQGIVTAIASNGFYIQDPTPDTSLDTSEAIFIFTTNAAILGARTLGEAVLVSGTVSEFRPGNNANNLTITQIANNTGVQSLSVTAWTNAPTTIIVPTVLGNGGRTIPISVIENDASNVETSGTFDPAQDGIDFYESLEGMLVQVNNPVATSPTANFGTSEEIWVVADNGDNATSRTARGGSLITPTDFNPERIQIDDLNSSLVLPEVSVGAKLSTITGVVNYDFNNYEVLVASAPTVVQASTLLKEVTTLTNSPTQLTIATFNVENLDPGDGAAKFSALASAIVSNLKSPDIINLEEIQDNNGAANDGTVDANLTLQTLIAAIAAAGGPTYEYRQINPVNNQDGGEPGGNIRVGFLFNSSRVDFVEGSLQRLTDSNLTDGDAFVSSRKPLVGKFVFNNQEVTVIGNHFNSKGGDQPLFGPNQPPTLTSEVQRNQQATIVKDFVQGQLTVNPNSHVVVAGDLNDFEFSNPLTILENGGLNTLIETLPADERYTYNFQGNAQVLDQILVSNSLLSKLDGFDVVHINSEFADQVSDHDPVVARFNLPVPNQAPTAVNLVNPVLTLPENTITASQIKVADIAITDDALGTNVLSLGGTDASAFEIVGNALYVKAGTALDFETKSSYTVTVNVDDATVDNTPDASTNFTLAVTDVPDFFQLQLLHYYGESGLLGVQTAPIMGALIDKFDDQYANTLVLGEGDSYIPGPWLIGGADPSLNSVPGIGSTALGRPDIAIMNAFGTDASALGNHEFDLGSPVLQGAIQSSGAWVGAQFPLITANLNFAADSSLRGLADASLGGTATNNFAGQEASAIKAKIAPYTVVTQGGQKIGIVGATTYDLLTKTSPNGTVPKDDGNPSTDDLQEVAAYIQAAVNALSAQGVNKIVMVDQLDTLDRNKALAPLVSGIDVMIAGGGHERMGDATDTPVGFNGHTADFIADAYPIVTAGADGKSTLIVTTDTEYTYLGRLVVDFDTNGEIVLSNLNPAINGAYASTEATLQAAYGTNNSANQIVASSTIGSNVKAITDAINNVIATKDGTIWGYTSVYLEGDRAFGRTQEVNLGDITADANIYATRQALGNGGFITSLKNGGGLRASIGSIAEDGSKIAPIANLGVGKPTGAISTLDIENALRFDNKLMVFDTTPQGLKNILEFAAGLSSGPTVQSGGYMQIGGIRVSYDPDNAAGSKVQNIALTDLNGNVTQVVYGNGAFYPTAPATISMVTLNFTANGGDGYPIKTNADNFRYLLTNGGVSATVSETLDFAVATTFSSVGLASVDILGEQKAFQKYLQDFYRTPETAYGIADTPAAQDQRIQNLNFRADTVLLAPTDITLGNTNIAENSSNSIVVGTLTATDPNSTGPFTFSLLDNAGGRFDINGTNLVVADGSLLNYEANTSHQVAVRVTDASGAFYDESFTIAVTNVNEAPTLQNAIADQTAGQNQPFSFTLPNNTFIDVDTGDILTYSATLDNGNLLPSWLTFNPNTKTFSGTPALANVGSLNIKVSVKDIALATASDIFTLAVGKIVTGTPQPDNLTGTDGNDDLSGLASNDTISGGAGRDRLDGGSQNDLLKGGAGDDTLIGGSEIDTLDGGADSDTYEAFGTQSEFDTFNDTGITGTDTLKNTGSNALTLNGFSPTNGIEIINGNSQAIVGNNLTNVLNFSNVSFINVSYVDGGIGNDSIVGTALGDNLRGSAGDDTLNGGAGSDRLDGGSQNDLLKGGAGDDTLIGGSEIDTLDGGADSDTYEAFATQSEFDTFNDTGITGTDTLKNTGSNALTLNGFSPTNGIEIINGNSQAIVGNNLTNVLNFSNISFINVSYVDGGIGNDSIVGTALGDDLRGSAGDDTLNGGAGSDRLDGGSQNDSLIGGAGNDTLIGGSEIDSLDGGADSDTYEASGVQSEFDTFNDTGVSGTDILKNTASAALTLNGFSATNGIDSIIGNSQAIVSNYNNNILNFSAVSLTNVLYVDGGYGDDSIVGSSSSDNLRGGDGHDTLTGGAGADNLFGGAGNDAFVFNTSTEGVDTIHDFATPSDRFNIFSTGFGGSVGNPGTLAASRFTLGSTASTINHRFIYNNQSGALFFDADGTNNIFQQVQIAQLIGNPPLTANNFTIV